MKIKNSEGTSVSLIFDFILLALCGLYFIFWDRTIWQAEWHTIFFHACHTLAVIGWAALPLVLSNESEIRKQWPAFRLHNPILYPVLLAGYAAAWAVLVFTGYYWVKGTGWYDHPIAWTFLQTVLFALLLFGLWRLKNVVSFEENAPSMFVNPDFHPLGEFDSEQVQWGREQKAGSSEPVSVFIPAGIAATFTAVIALSAQRPSLLLFIIAWTAGRWLVWPAARARRSFKVAWSVLIALTVWWLYF